MKCVSRNMMGMVSWIYRCATQRCLSLARKISEIAPRVLGGISSFLPCFSSKRQIALPPKKDVSDSQKKTSSLAKDANLAQKTYSPKEEPKSPVLDLACSTPLFSPGREPAVVGHFEGFFLESEEEEGSDVERAIEASKIIGDRVYKTTQEDDEEVQRAFWNELHSGSISRSSDEGVEPIRLISEDDLELQRTLKEILKREGSGSSSRTPSLALEDEDDPELRNSLGLTEAAQFTEERQAQDHEYEMVLALERSKTEFEENLRQERADWEQEVLAFNKRMEELMPLSKERTNGFLDLDRQRMVLERGQWQHWDVEALKKVVERLSKSAKQLLGEKQPLSFENPCTGVYLKVKNGLERFTDLSESDKKNLECMESLYKTLSSQIDTQSRLKPSIAFWEGVTAHIKSSSMIKGATNSEIFIGDKRSV